MPKNILEEYKKAIIKQYQKEKLGENYRFLEKPSRAKLRDLCWERFKENDNPDDLKNFETFFEFTFELTKKNELIKKTGKFRSIGDFLRNETESPTDDIIELAAILVDFNLRPYNKFRRFFLNENETNLVDSGNLDLVRENDNMISEEIITKKSFDSFGEEGNIKSDKLTDETIKPISFRSKVGKMLSKKSNQILLLIFIILFSTCIFFAQRKQCMQWSTDHYEKVSCDLEVKGIGNYNKIEPFDEITFNLKKITICDTTTCFDKNGVAIIWYAKTANGVDFFNEHGRHPENNKPLRPVTQYIIDKYVK